MKFIRPDTRAHACYDYAYGRIEVRLFEPVGDRRAVAQPVSFQVPAQDGEIIPPTVRLDDEQAQQLMDALWDCGVRPTGGKGSAGQLAATEKHLDDFRAIVFKNMGIPVGRES